jgi:hypothetical protein
MGSGREELTFVIAVRRAETMTTSSSCLAVILALAPPVTAASWVRRWLIAVIIVEDVESGVNVERGEAASTYTVDYVSVGRA